MLRCLFYIHKKFPNTSIRIHEEKQQHQNKENAGSSQKQLSMSSTPNLILFKVSPNRPP